MKKFFTLFAVLSLMAVSSRAQSLLKGDANGDGEVDISDVVFVVNKILSDDSYQTSCDVNGDDVVDISDVINLVNVVLKGNNSLLCCPDGNHPHMIDLGLPSGTKWACCNLGASSPEDYGGYYAWGETEEKSEYSPSNYKFAKLDDVNGETWYNGHSYYIQDIGSDISGTEYDVAHVKWGDGWHMPNLTQIIEMLYNTTSEYTSMNGVVGMKFMGSNGGTIFIPAAGGYDGSEIFYAGESGSCWSSSKYNENYYINSEFSACGFGFVSNVTNPYYFDGSTRYRGLSVRPVR